MTQGKYGNLDASVVSYGPCQTPTLNFCVERHQKIASFQPEPFWVVRPHVSKGGQSITLEWGRGRLFDMDIAQMFKKVVTDGQQLKVRTHSQSDQALLLEVMQSMVRHSSCSCKDLHSTILISISMLEVDGQVTPNQHN